jgi:phosphatidylglycerophosphate synthase
MQAYIHYFLHFGAPLLIAFLFFRKEWKKIYLIFALSMLVDLDHLLANPFFDPNRCSINFHPLHSYYAILIYTLLLIPKKTSIIAFALLFHMLTDWIDCYMTLNNW